MLVFLLNNCIFQNTYSKSIQVKKPGKKIESCTGHIIEWESWDGHVILNYSYFLKHQAEFLQMWIVFPSSKMALIPAKFEVSNDIYFWAVYVWEFHFG